MSPLLLVPLLVLSQTHSRWAASVRAEVRARSATAQDSGATAAGDAELRPSLQGVIFSGPWTFTGGYTGTLRTREPYLLDRAGRPVGEHSHALALEGVWAKEAAARAFLGEYLSYGTLDLSTLNRPDATGQALPPPQPVRAGLGVVRELTSDTSAGVDWFLSRTFTLTTAAGFVYGGGADEASRVSLPVQSTIRGAARASWLASPRDTGGLSLAGQYVRFFQVPASATRAAYPGARVVIIELAASYARQLGPNTSCAASVGATGLFGQLPDPDPAAAGAFRSSTAVAPLVTAGVSHRVPLRAQRVDLRLNAQLAPFVDRFAGTAYQRVEGSGSIGWTHVKQLSASLQAGVAEALPGVGATTTTVYGEAAAGYAGDPWWRLELQGRLSVVRAGSALENQWVVGLSLSFLAASEQPRSVRE